MLRGCCGSIRQGAWCVCTGSGRPRPLLRDALHVQCSHDGVVPSQSAALAISTGNRVQQRRQHNCNGPTGQVAVRRGPRIPVASGCCLHSLGHCAGHSRGGARAGGAAATATAATASITAVRVGRSGLSRRGGPAASASAAAGLTEAGGAAGLGSGSGGGSRAAPPRQRRLAGWGLATQPRRNAAASLVGANMRAVNAAGGGATVAPALSALGTASSVPGASVAEPSGSGRSTAADGVRRLTSCGGGSGGDGDGGSAGPPPVLLVVTSMDGNSTSASHSENGSLKSSPSSPLASSKDGAAASEGLITSTASSFVQDRSGGLGRLGKFSHRLVVAYDGTDYCGWQLQPSAPTVQRLLESALCTVLREERAVLGVRAAGRTDSGVHARGQVVQFSCNREVDVDKMPYKLNSVLPHDIRVLRVTRTAPDFSVTCSALGKCYHYSLTNAETHDPLRHRYAMHVRKQLDLVAMRAAAAALEGTHDFTQFSNIGEEGGRPRRRNPVKTLRRVEVVELGDGMPGAVRIEPHIAGGAARSKSLLGIFLRSTAVPQ
ncbi:hypothetical protein Vretifemale_20088 [Volvox reticuliferus]|uniref:Pseudouridine synthase I TruA alpha/beta domain-containing protein n=2 Tax=Volvox reticuliferus TaxID=1737510 RepID=A0A8J4D0E8_9CHLO|nr:hypothetical protein Vretifemale_20088 [Volvox reticuliferus]